MAGVIICGVDDSESAKGAARVARALSAQFAVPVVFVRVVEPGAGDGKARAITERLERLRAGASEVDCGAGWLVEAGHPADGLVAAAKRVHASMIVVGSTGPRSSLLGSVSADVSRRAPCPVVVVPSGADGRVNGRVADHRTSAAMRADAGAIVRFGSGGGDTEFAGGIARFALGGGGTEFAGTIARFSLGSAEGGG